MAEFKNELLRQAIADADALKETAIANAKLSLEEEFTPAIKEMLANRLRAESGVDEEAITEEEIDEDLNSSGIGKGDNKHPEGFTSSGVGKSGKSGTAAPVQTEGKEHTNLDSSEIGTGENKKPDSDASSSSEIGEGIEPFANANEGTDEADDEFNLDEIIAELEEDIAALDRKDADDDDDDDDDSEFETDAEDGEEKEDGEGNEPSAEDDKTDDSSFEKDAGSLDKGADDSLDSLEKGSEEGGEEKPDFGNDSGIKTDIPAATSDSPFEDDKEGHLDLESILAELDEEEHAAETQHNQSAAELAALKTELEEYRRAIKGLSVRLQETNLLNAKLLYTNKLFKKEGLNTDQKINIVETFDRATTVREVKLVYTTLVETVINVSKPKLIPSRKTVVSEGFASKAAGTSTKKEETSPEVLQENTQVRRLQYLAGIIHD